MGTWTIPVRLSGRRPMARLYQHRNTTKLALWNLAPNTTGKTLNSMLQVHGDVRSVQMMTDVMTGHCSGVAYVTVDDLVPGSARAALNGSFCGGRIIQVSIEHKPGRSIFSAVGKPVD